MTAVLIEPAVRAPLRALPIPDTEPAPDRPGWADPVQATPGESPGPGQLSLALVPSYDDVEDEVIFGRQPTSSSTLPDPRGWVGRIVQAVLECLGGDRSLAQLVRWTTLDVYAGLQRRVALTGGRPDSGRRAVVRSVHLSAPADGIVEACAVVVSGGRARAMALRLEGLDGRWLVTALELG